MRRLVFSLHRWIGLLLGPVMLLWCLSGFVMMYMPYPSLTSDEARQARPVLDLDNCCDTAPMESLGLVDVHRFELSMRAGRPVLQVIASNGQRPLLDLSSGELIAEVDAAEARVIAEEFQRLRGIKGALGDGERLQVDQWTVSAALDPHRPLYRFAAQDEAGSEWYISSRRGEVLQFTTARQRFWNWLGAVPHWLYPTVLRQHDGLWAQVVIVLSLLGSFLTALGLYIGISRWRRLPSGRHSPYRGLALWHHYAGLACGLFLLTWAASGLFSMRPWGWFDSAGRVEVMRRLEGLPLFSAEVASVVERLPTAELPVDTLAVEGYAQLGKLYLLLHRQDGSVLRLDGRSLQPAPEPDWKALARQVAGRAGIRDASMLEREDTYYYDGHDITGELPAYRLILDDAQQTRIYLDAVSGELIAYVDGAEKRYRWLFSALHSLDVGWLRSRPLWDLVMLLLLAGATLGSLTGLLMGLRLLRRQGRR